MVVLVVMVVTGEGQGRGARDREEVEVQEEEEKERGRRCKVEKRWKIIVNQDHQHRSDILFGQQPDKVLENTGGICPSIPPSAPSSELCLLWGPF